MNKLLCEFHFRLTGTHLAQSTSHEICWLGSFFLSEGETKPPLFELPQHAAVLLTAIKGEVGRGGRSPAVRSQPSQPCVGGERGLAPEPAK